MNLIKINLLPYREILEQKQKKQFQFVMLFGVAAGGVAAFLVWGALAGLITNQEGRNEELNAGIKELDAQIVKVKELQAQKQSFLERKQKVEELDNKRFEGARIVDTVNQLVPEGSYLTSIQNIGGSDAQISNTYTLVGKAISDNKVAMFMTALPSTGVFDTPKLDSINKTDNGQEFKITANLLEQKKPTVTQSSVSAKSTATSASAPAASATTE
ncbi:PilN domain-containing protein [Kingella sp. (in: b-proteobacteria)]|uniref:PilN domain-containing protein n=1 Tax=Kingella sp. (in: b-proteobacteria) TaxID=2020713 RepID=UPI0026DD1BB4|nr:PilN domain-containing protein [Kingella sp. (in: b-proteobacteria)]MDO4657414.1 PilN domain-containing protein [Kingella sp. (in: b-proteobacteria)]